MYARRLKFDTTWPGWHHYALARMYRRSGAYKVQKNETGNALSSVSSAPVNFKIKSIWKGTHNLTLWIESDSSAFSWAPPIVSHRTLPGAHMSKLVSISCVDLEFQPIDALEHSFRSVLQVQYPFCSKALAVGFSGPDLVHVEIVEMSKKPSRHDFKLASREQCPISKPWRALSQNLSHLADMIGNETVVQLENENAVTYSLHLFARFRKHLINIASI